MADNQMLMKQDDMPTGANEATKLKRESYSMYDYFRLHPSVLIACISAIVAIISYLINYAIFRYDSAYLSYWNVKNTFVSSFTHGKIYIVFGSFFYCFILTLIHYFMSRTSEAYRHHGKILSLFRFYTKSFKREQRHLRKIENRFNQILKRIPDIDKQECNNKATDIEEEIKKAKERLSLMFDGIITIKEARRAYAHRILVDVIFSIFFVYLFGLVVFLMFLPLSSLIEFLQVGVIFTIVIFFDVIVYFVPAYISSNITRKKYDDLNISKLISDALDTEKHKFPIWKFADHGLKIIFSNKKIKLFVTQFIMTVVVLLIVLTSSGRNSAKSQKTFDIFTDDLGTYAIIYTNSDYIVLEEVTHSNTSIDIYTSNQRILSLTDISYTTTEFEQVTIHDNKGSS